MRKQVLDDTAKKIWQTRDKGLFYRYYRPLLTILRELADKE